MTLTQARAQRDYLYDTLKDCDIDEKSLDRCCQGICELPYTLGMWAEDFNEACDIVRRLEKAAYEEAMANA